MASKKAAAKTPDAPAPEKKFLDGYRVVAVQIDNIMRIPFLRVRPAGNVVLVNGDNESGKSSLLNSISWAIDGTSDIPTLPVRKGNKNGKIEVDLGDLRVTRFFTAIDPTTNQKGHGYISRIEVAERSRTDAKRFSTMREPQKVLDALKSQISFDPLAFTSMKPKEQFEVLRGLVKLDIDIDQLARDKQISYDARRDAGRDVDQLSSRLKMMAEPPPDLPAAPVNVAALTQKLQDAANHNSRVEAAKVRKTSIEEQIESTGATADRLRQEALAKLQEAQQLDGIGLSTNLLKQVEGSSYRIAELRAEANAITIGETIDTDAVAQELQSAQAINAAIGRAEQYRATKAEYDAKLAEWGKHDAAVKKADQDRADAIAKAKMPVEGLSIGDGEVMFEGLPFNQASNAQQIRISVMLGIVANPKMRVMYIKDGSLLGTKMLAIIEQLAEEYNYQIWIERVDTTSKVGIMMVDGEGTGDEVEAPAK